jgi:hypothetical protein
VDQYDQAEDHDIEIVHVIVRGGYVISQCIDMDTEDGWEPPFGGVILAVTVLAGGLVGVIFLKVNVPL